MHLDGVYKPCIMQLIVWLGSYWTWNANRDRDLLWFLTNVLKTYIAKEFYSRRWPSPISIRRRRPRASRTCSSRSSPRSCAASGARPPTSPRSPARWPPRPLWSWSSPWRGPSRAGGTAGRRSRRWRRGCRRRRRPRASTRGGGPTARPCQTGAAVSTLGPREPWGKLSFSKFWLKINLEASKKASHTSPRLIFTFMQNVTPK